jgi:Tol biopolymer transport system component
MKRLRNSQGVTGLFVGLLLIGAATNTCSADLSGWIAFGSSRDGDPDVWAIRPDGTGLRQIVNMPGEQGFPGWSPDSRKIVYSHNVNPYGSVSQLWVYDWFSGANTKIYDAHNYYGADLGSFAVWQPAWSPDGTKILFREDSSYNNPHLTLINADGTGRQVLPLSGWVESPSWAPSGNEFVYNNRWDLFIYDFTSVRTLASGTHYQGQADWGPTGLIAFQDNWNIAVIDPLTAAQQLLTTGGGSWEPSWSPDGSHILYRHGGNPWIMDSSGANPFMIDIGGSSGDYDWGNPVPVPGAALLGYLGFATALAVLRRQHSLV